MARFSLILSGIGVFVGAGFLTCLIGCGGSGSTSQQQPLQISTRPPLQNGTAGTPYPSQTLVATGGVQPYAWSISSGTLPPGLTLAASTGVISGTPTAPGGASFTVMVKDSEMTPQTRSAMFTITITAAGSPISHVVVIFQENRSTDNLFQDPVLYNPPPAGHGADIAQSGVDSSGNVIPLKKVSLGVDYDPDHGHLAWSEMCDLQADGQCKMDGADEIHVNCSKGAKDCGPDFHDLTFEYVDPNDVQPYFQMAEQYTFGDRMFQTNQGPSFPAHQFIISGTSWPGDPGGILYASDLFASENTNGTSAPSAGCDAEAGSTVALIDSTGSEKSNPAIYPCFDHMTLTDLLEGKGLDWRYYAPGTSGYGNPAIWMGPEAIQHICGPNNPPPNGTACVGTDWTEHVVLTQTQVLNDIAAGNLAAVTWIVPDGQDSDHPGNMPGNTGPSWVASIVNAIGGSSFWGNTAIFVTWDDWGGWYDHVPPEQVLVNCSGFGCGYIYGFRVPLIVISPYVKAGYVSHVNHDFGSILRYTEENFGIAPGALGYADAAADDMSDCFDYSQTPLKFQTIPSLVKAEFFVNSTRPPTPPDTD